jgi:AhpD family alkylhydroperoxidase
MTMTRVAMLPVEQWDSELRAMTLADEATPLEQGLLRIMAQVPEITKAYLQFATALARHRSLPRRLSELVRLRLAFHNQCRSCMAIRYRSAVDDGMTENLVCSLERPYEAPDLTEAEKAALRYADLSATDHLSIGDAEFDALRRHFSEAQIVELGLWIANCIGFGRLGAAWNMVEELPDAFQDKSGGPVTPWAHDDAIVVRG